MRGPTEVVVSHVESAKDDLVRAVPSPRGVPATSLADAILAFETGLRTALDAVEDDERWAPYRAAILSSLDKAERLRLEAPALDHESLLDVLAELIAPLEVFEEI